MTPEEYMDILRESGEAIMVSRSQLPELASKGISEAMLREIGVKIVEDKDIKPDSIVICPDGQDFFFKDNIFTVCAECGGCIQHRPDVPAHLKKVCVGCAQELAKKPH